MIVRFGGRGEWELDDALFELRRAGSPVAVQPKVLALLIHLTRQRDRTVSKAELFQALWPGERVGEGSLTRAVRGARLAVGDSGDGQSVIRSVRGIGYRFVASIDADRPRPLRIDGVLPTFYDLRTHVSDETLDAIREKFTKILTPIRINAALAEAPRTGKTIYELDPSARGAVDYALLAEDLGLA